MRLTVRKISPPMFALALTALAAAAMVPALRAIEEDELAARGRVVYRVYCSNCHGAQAKGDGKLAPLLTVKPADLTRIAERAGGTYPTDQVRSKIDGRAPVEGHGLQEMPVWGLSFQDPNKLADQENEVAAKLDQLVAFLKTMQVPASAR